HRVARGVEEAAAAMHVPPALEIKAPGVRPQEQEALERLLGLARDVGRARDMRLAGMPELELRALLLAIGAVDQQHGPAVLNARRPPPPPRRSAGRCGTARA